MGERLTMKQKRFTNALIEVPTRSIAEAGRIAGWKDRQSAYRSLQKPTVQTELRRFLDALEAAGISDNASAKVLADAMRAVTVIAGNEMPDHRIRLQANETYLKLRRLISPPSEVGKPQDIPVVMIVDYGRGT